MLQRLVLLGALMLPLAPVYKGQSLEKKKSSDDGALLKVTLLSDIQALETEARQLDKPIGRGLAMAEIAGAAWLLDKAMAKRLLREAYELTFPPEEERDALRGKPVGAAPTVPTEIDRARGVVRMRVLDIASRDKAFAAELTQLGAQQLGRQEESSRYSNLAAASLATGDVNTASKYLLNSIEADPTQITASFGIIQLAARDRKAADQLIIQYLERLRAIPLSMSGGSALRTYFSLRNIVFTNDSFDPRNRQVPPAGPAVIKAYVRYVVESLSNLEQREPGSLQNLRGVLVSTWLPLNQYAPELAGAFLELEKLSRRPGGDATLPLPGDREEGKARYDERVKKSLDSGKADELTIKLAISQGDFAAARKLIESLPEGKEKSRLTEFLNIREAMNLTARNDILGAEMLARRLSEAVSILQVYPPLIAKCVANKEPSRASVLAYQATQQVKRAEDQAALPLSLSKLAKAIAPVDTTLALEILDEAVLAANKSDVDTGDGNVGVDIGVFKELAPKNELQTRQVAARLKDSLRQIVALAAIYQWKAGELTKQEKTSQ
jgi:hypothetical protein